MSIKRAYVAISVLVLTVSTGVWALAAARIGQGNADQLADGFLFENAQTFSGAQFPASHTQLVKWPLFWLLAVLHNSQSAYLVITVLLAMITVGLLAWLLYRMERRPVVFGTLCLGLACTLVLVPAQVHGSITAPLSLAMVTGRNIEYLLYIASLILFVRAAAIISWKWGIGVALLGLLLASDRFFLPISIVGGAALWLIAYVSRRPQMSALARRWVLGSSLAWLVSFGLLWIARQFTYIVGPSSPYSWLDSVNNIRPAMMGLYQGLLLNFGITSGAGKLTTITASVNVGIALVTVYAIVKVIGHIRANPQQLCAAQLLTAMLLLSSVAAAVFYVVANHPYVADARYLSLFLFTGIIAVATYTRSTIHTRLASKQYYVIGSVLVVATIIGNVSVWQHTDQILARSELLRRNASIAQALSAHPKRIQILVGDYWRVLPIKELSDGSSQQIMPLTACAQPRQVLTSKAWNKRLLTHSFAYLLPLVPAGTPYGTCTLGLVEYLYGPPSSVTVIAGTAHSPRELLLFYNDGAADTHGRTTVPPRPVLGAPTDGNATPTGSMMTPLDAPS